MSSQNIKILLFVLVAVIITVITLFYLTNKQTSISTTNTKENDPIHTTRVNTSEWVIYDDNERGFKFKYPNTFHAIEGTEYEEPYAYSAYIVFPDKFQDPDNLELRKVENLMAYEMTIVPLGSRENYGESNVDILKALKVTNDLEEITTADGHVIFFDVNSGDSAYYIGDRVYKFILTGYNNSNKNTKEETNDLEFKNDYPNYIKLMRGIFSTLEFKKS